MESMGFRRLNDLGLYHSERSEDATKGPEGPEASKYHRFNWPTNLTYSMATQATIKRAQITTVNG